MSTLRDEVLRTFSAGRPTAIVTLLQAKEMVRLNTVFTLRRRESSGESLSG